MRCPNCSATNPPNADWCGQCAMSFQQQPATVTPFARPAPAPAGISTAARAAHPAGGPPGAGWPVPSMDGMGAVGLDRFPPGVWLRFAGRFLDALAIFGAAFVIQLTVMIAWYTPRPAASNLLWFLVAVGYETIMVAATGRTIGKLAIGARVVSDDGGPVGPARAALRALLANLFCVALLPAALLGISIERDSRRRGWHDRIAGTRVIRPS
jgi:uncharacterized RDD family membrane protein YckC